MKLYRSLYLLLAVQGLALPSLASAATQTTPQEDTNPVANNLFIAQAGARTSGESDARSNREAQLAVRQKLIDDAAARIKSGHSKDAYALLAPYQSIMAGDVEYDYLLGLAALDSGKPNEAIFALERVLAVQPNHLQARAEIARAYLAAGEVAASKQEFETVQAQNPPKEVSATIQKYLDIIETERSEKTTAIRGYIEAAVGDDSNANSATSSRQIPMLGGVWVLDSNGVAQHDTFGNLAAGFNVRHLLSQEWALIGGGNVNQRSNSTIHNLDSTSADANLGVSLTQGNDNYSLLVQAQTFLLNSKAYRDTVGLAGQWQRNLDNNSQSSVYLQYTDMTYSGQPVRNADRYVAGLAYAQIFDGGYKPLLYVSAYAGTEIPQKGNVKYIGNDLYGTRLGGELKISPDMTFLASVGLESRAYGGVDPLASKTRNDLQTDLRVALAYVLAQKWTVTPSISYTNNDSNILINKYERTQLSLSVRRDFN